MNVRDLINILKNLDPEMPVCLEINKDEVVENITPEVEFAYQDEDGILWPYNTGEDKLTEVVVLGPHEE